MQLIFFSPVSTINQSQISFLYVILQSHLINCQSCFVFVGLQAFSRKMISSGEEKQKKIVTMLSDRAVPSQLSYSLTPSKNTVICVCQSVIEGNAFIILKKKKTYIFNYYSDFN
jgi:hypothetical protein